MASGLFVPETRVLAVASHVVSGYVGNKIAVFVLQSLGCDVAALNTVQFSNHTGYRQFKGTKVTAQEITDLYEGLRQSYLDDFDLMLSGYIPGAEAVAAVGDIARKLKAKTKSQPGNFFWVLDPVMGDNGRLYVAEDVVPAYKSLIPYADLIFPNEFEAELLSGVKITDMETLTQAIQAIHDTYRVPHVVITSVTFTPVGQRPSHLSVVGSSKTSAGRARLFKIVFPSIDSYFSGTGDMFAALMVVRMRQAVEAAASSDPAGGDLRRKASWLSDDGVAATDLPLARAAERVLASMHEVLTKTSEGMKRIVERTEAEMTDAERGDDAKMHLVKAKAAEVQLVRNLDSLRAPKISFPVEAV